LARFNIVLTGIQLSAACVKLIASVERLDEIDNGSGVRAEVKLSAPLVRPPSASYI
jgi:hypothetical protein